MDLEKEQKIKIWLSVITKILLGVFLVFKITQFAVNHFAENQLIDDAVETVVPKDTITEVAPDFSNKALGDTDTPKSNEALVPGNKIEVLPNTASIYIFGENGLDAPLVNQLGRTFFKEYTIKVQGGYKKEELLQGELRSATNSELVCVGTVDYSYFTNQFNMITCRVNLNFETYNRITGNKVLELSRSFDEGGPGGSEGDARATALQKIHP